VESNKNKIEMDSLKNKEKINNKEKIRDFHYKK